MKLMRYGFTKWTSKEAHDAALELEAAKAHIQQAMPLISGIASQVNTELAGGKGL